MIKGLLGRKLGMSTIFDQEGNAIPVTVLEVGPCAVVQVKTLEKDGYSGVQLGFDEKRQKSTNQALRGHFQKAQVPPKRFVLEIGLSQPNPELKPGQEIKLEQVFKVNEFVDVVGWTKGRGFQGVFKRWGFRGSDGAHGTHEYFRHGGSIGTNTTPGRVLKGKKMAGHYGNERVKMENLKIVEIKPEDNLMLVKGSVPGPKNRYIVVFHAVKKTSQASSQKSG